MNFKAGYMNVKPHRRDKSILLREVGTHLCAGFFCCLKAGYNGMTGWMGYDFAKTSCVTERAKQRCGETPGQAQKNDIQTDRQNIYGKDSDDVHNSNEHRIVPPTIPIHSLKACGLTQGILSYNPEKNNFLDWR